MTPHGREAVTGLRAPDLRRSVEGAGHDFVPETIKGIDRTPNVERACAREKRDEREERKEERNSSIFPWIARQCRATSVLLSVGSILSRLKSLIMVSRCETANSRGWIVERDGVDHVLMAFESKKLRSTVDVPNFTSSIVAARQASVDQMGDRPR